MSTSQPRRGEIWRVNLDPTIGDEIGKTRPVVVMSVGNVGALQLRVTVPFTGWQQHFENHPWLVRILPSDNNGLSKTSAADTFQVTSLSLLRFQKQIGELSELEIDDIADAIALTVGYTIKSIL